MYVAGFERLFRPIGDWSMFTTLCTCSMPSTPSCSPGSVRVSTSRFHSALYRMSLISVLLPEPDAPVIAISLPSGNVDVDDLEVVLARAADRQRRVPLPLRRCFGIAIERLPERNCPVGDALHASTSVERALHHHLAAVHARARAHLDDVVRGANRVLVVLDDDHRVADVAQALERRDHLHVVLRMQPDARLVEHVEHAHEPRADLRREPDALRLAAGERARAAVEVQIVEADAEQQLEPPADLLQHLLARVRPAARRLDGAEEGVQLVEVELADVVRSSCRRS